MRKRSFRVISLVLSLIFLCSVFTGCNALDDMKQAQAFQDEDDNIILNGCKYKPIPIRKMSFLLNFDLVETKYIYITEHDVPVLLSENLYITKGNVTTNGKYLYVERFGYYCREDDYQDFSERLDNGFVPDVLAAPYSYYDKEIGEMVYGNYLLTEEEANAVKTVIETMKSVEVDDYRPFQADEHCDVYESSDDLIFNRLIFTVERSGNKFKVVTKTGNITQRYTVPDTMFSIFKGIMVKSHHAR